MVKKLKKQKAKKVVIEELEEEKSFVELLSEREETERKAQGLLTDEQLAEQDVIKLAKQHTAEAVAALVHWANSRNPLLAASSIKAAEILINRAHGAALQEIKHMGSDGYPLQTNFNIVFVNRDEVQARQQKTIEHRQDLEQPQTSLGNTSEVAPSVVMKPKIILRKMNGAST